MRTSIFAFTCVNAKVRADMCVLHIKFSCDTEMFSTRKQYKAFMKKVNDLDELSAKLHSKAKTDAAFQEVSKECGQKVDLLCSRTSGPKYEVQNFLADIEGFIKAAKANEDPAQVLFALGYVLNVLIIFAWTLFLMFFMKCI